jgi:drug/metabolite transporter (DMT)-like permease
MKPDLSRASLGHRSTLLWAYAALTLAALFWGGNWPIARWIQEQVPPLTLALMRWGTAGAMLLPFALPSLLRAGAAFRREWRQLAVFGILGVAGFNVLSYTGITFTTATNGALLNTASPVFLILLSAFGLGERIGWTEIAGIAVSLIGVLAIITRGVPESLLTLSVNTGDVLVLGAVLLWTVYTVLLRVWHTALPPLAFLLATILLSLPILIAASAAELVWGSRLPALNAETIGAALYLGLFPSIGAYIFWAYGVRRVGPTRAILFQYLIPVFASGLAVMLLGERVQLFHLAGAALIIGGLSIATRSRPS